MIDPPPSDPPASRLAALKEIADEMAHELFIVGNHPALGVDHVMVERWRHRLAILSADPPVPPPGEATRRMLIAAWHDGFSYDRLSRDEADQKAVDFADWQLDILAKPVPAPPAETLSDEERSFILVRAGKSANKARQFARICRGPNGIAGEAAQWDHEAHVWESISTKLSQAGPRPASGLCDNEMTQRVGQRRRGYTCKLADNHEGSCQFTQVAEDRPVSGREDQP